MAQDPKLWVRVVEAHATRTYVAVILSVSAGLTLLVLAVGAVWNTVANPEVTDLSSNYMTAISGPLGVVFGGLTGYLGYQMGQTKTSKSGEFPQDDDIVLDVKPPEIPEP